jgi:pimeloyl-ACP methyl ester carboxylesterase
VEFAADFVPFRSLLFSLLILLAGCATPERVAQMIITAPNLQKSQPPPHWADKWLSAFSGGTNRFEKMTIPVGPPEARLEAISLAPGDYHLHFASSLENRPNGKRAFQVKAFQQTNCLVDCLREQGTIFVLHGYSIQKETMIPWAFLLAEVGFRVILVDLRGHGESSGQNFSCGKYESADLVQVLDRLMAEGSCRGPIGALGLSFGAEVALHWAARDPRVKTVVAIAPYNDPEEAFLRFARELKVPVSSKIIRQAFPIVAAKLDLNWTDWSGEAAMRRLKVPVLLIGGEKDSISPPEDLAALSDVAPAGTKTLLIPDANHFLIGFWFQELADPIKAWMTEKLSGASLASLQRE